MGGLGTAALLSLEHVPFRERGLVDARGHAAPPGGNRSEDERRGRGAEVMPLAGGAGAGPAEHPLGAGSGPAPGFAVCLRGLRLRGCHGVLEQEARRPQPFVVDVELCLDLRQAALRDDLAATVNYAEVARVAAAVVGGPRRRLIETLAARIADGILAAFPVVDGGTVVVHKPEAPVGLPLADVSVRYPFARGLAGGPRTAEVGGGGGVPLAGE